MNIEEKVAQQLRQYMGDVDADAATASVLATLREAGVELSPPVEPSPPSEWRLVRLQEAVVIDPGAGNAPLYRIVDEGSP